MDTAWICDASVFVTSEIKRFGPHDLNSAKVILIATLCNLWGPGKVRFVGTAAFYCMTCCLARCHCSPQKSSCRVVISHWLTRLILIGVSATKSHSLWLFPARKMSPQVADICSSFQLTSSSNQFQQEAIS